LSTAPDVLATEIAADLETALEQFTKIAAKLGGKARWFFVRAQMPVGQRAILCFLTAPSV
jgi:hypothetical protein